MRQFGAKTVSVKKHEDISGSIKEIPLFSRLDEGSLKYLCEGANIADFASGDTVAPPLGEPCITVIIRGSASVTKPIGEKELLMRIASKGSVTGVASLFDGEELTAPVSRLKANTAVSALFISRERIRELIKTDGGFAESYVRFLTSRIRYLNSRIKAYTSGSAEAKLAFQILLSDENGSGRAAFGMSLTKLADTLDIGRASLYRAIDTLVSKGVIEKRGREILILDREALEKTADGM